MLLLCLLIMYDESQLCRYAKNIRFEPAIRRGVPALQL